MCPDTELTLWCQNYRPSVMCSRPEFKLGLHKKGHNRLLAISVVSVLFASHCDRYT